MHLCIRSLLSSRTRVFITEIRVSPDHNRRSRRESAVNPPRRRRLLLTVQPQPQQQQQQRRPQQVPGELVVSGRPADPPPVMFMFLRPPHGHDDATQPRLPTVSRASAFRQLAASKPLSDGSRLFSTAPAEDHSHKLISESTSIARLKATYAGVLLANLDSSR